MRPLDELLSGSGGSGIQVLADYIEQSIHEQWRRVLDECSEELQRRYDEVGEPAYGVFASRLFRPIRKQLESAGFRSEPRFPGTLAASRERGPIEERERLMWCVMRRNLGVPFGTIVVGLFHDHTRFRIPHPPEILALDQTDTEAIVREMSRGAA